MSGKLESSSAAIKPVCRLIWRELAFVDVLNLWELGKKLRLNVGLNRVMALLLNLVGVLSCNYADENEKERERAV